MRFLSVLFTLASLGLVACAEPLAPISESVQYGPTDDRHEVYEEPPGAHRSIAEQSVAMQMFDDDLDYRGPERLSITSTRTLGEAKNLCDGEPFDDQRGRAREARAAPSLLDQEPRSAAPRPDHAMRRWLARRWLARRCSPQPSDPG